MFLKTLIVIFWVFQKDWNRGNYWQFTFQIGLRILYPVSYAWKLLLKDSRSLIDNSNDKKLFHLRFYELKEMCCLGDLNAFIFL